MNTISYKGFTGTVDFDEKSKTYSGKITNTDDNVLVLYEGATLGKLYEDFKSAVDDYVKDMETI